MFLPNEDSNSDEDPYCNNDKNQEEEKNETDKIDPLAAI